MNQRKLRKMPQILWEVDRDGDIEVEMDDSDSQGGCDYRYLYLTELDLEVMLNAMAAIQEAAGVPNNPPGPPDGISMVQPTGYTVTAWDDPEYLVTPWGFIPNK